MSSNMSETQPREQITVAKWAMTGVIIPCLLLLFTLTICHLMSIFRLKSGQIYRENNRWRVYILAFTIMGCIGLTMLGLTVWLDWRGSANYCYAFQTYLSIAYVVMRQCAALVMYSRAKVVHDGLRLKGFRLQLYRNLIFYAIVIGVWIAFGWSFWTNYKGKVIPEGVCIYYSKFPPVILSFAVLDAIVGICLLMLFVIPLTQHTREMAGMREQSRVTATLNDVIWSNFRISVSIIVVDMVGLAIMTVLLSISNGEDVDPSIEHYRMWAITVPAMFVFVTSLLLHSITVTWMPRRFRGYFKRSEFSANDLNSNSKDKYNANPDMLLETLYLGKLSGDGLKIETHIKVRRYIIPFDTMLARLIGHERATLFADFCLQHVFLWRFVLLTYFGSQSIILAVLLMGAVPEYVGFVCLAIAVPTWIVDNNFSLPVVRILCTKSQTLVRLGLSFGLMLLLCDVVSWGPRSAGVVAIFMGFQYITFVDALVKQARNGFFVLVGVLAPTLPVWLLVLLQFDLIEGRQNTVIRFGIFEPFEYSMYLLARDIAFLLSFLNARDGFAVMKSSSSKWFLTLTGDVPIRVIGLKDGLGGSNSPRFESDGRSLGAGPDEHALNLSSTRARKSFYLDEGHIIDTLELREQDSLVVWLFGSERGAAVINIFTQPWFRLLNEYLLAMPLVFVVALVIPGFLDAAFTWVFMLSLVPFIRNIGLRSARLLAILMFNIGFLFEVLVVSAAMTFIAESFEDRFKDVLFAYLAVFWFDVRTADARCVFFHTKTRRGRRLSPFERVFYRVAGASITFGFVALPVMLFLGISVKTNMTNGFSILNEPLDYPNKLNVVLYYQGGVDGVWFVMWKLIFDVYSDLLTRGKGIQLRYIRAPLAPKFVERRILSPSLPIAPPMESFVVDQVVVQANSVVISTGPASVHASKSLSAHGDTREPPSDG